ncbi:MULTISPECIES: pyridoxal phosphate-dependent aminotransferase [unclassified Nocardia]|uniref:pyridoxal phosphate-dependent aminotransferase n=1 Tax=unclassified Nocardia TaxID=2637762 RepID=UPI001CE49B2E|nr:MULTISPECIES: pyridoxal phosphate-dependent aminotransferase [unclassified Nocardia]
MTSALTDIGTWQHEPGLATVAKRSEARKRLVRKQLGADAQFAGTEGRWYSGVLDAYHGETGLPLHPDAAAALDRAWRELMSMRDPGVAPEYANEYRDGALYDKRQPLILRELAAHKLFGRLAAPDIAVPGIAVHPDEVIVCPYSSTMLLEEAVATLARPGGVIVCPEGFYKSSSIHVEKFGLRVVSCPVAPDQTFKIDPELLARCLDDFASRGELCGVLLTLPGNPVVVDYSADELARIAQVLLDSGAPIICDMAFDAMVARHIPIAALALPGGRLYDRVLTVTGNSKGYNAFGPCKLGAACSGDAEWLARIRERLTISFQRESIHLARAIVEHTPEAYFAHNRTLMRRQLDRARRHIDAINARVGAQVLRPLGSSQGMFRTIAFADDLLAAAGVESSAQLEDLLLAAAGVDSVALDRTGSARLGVRLNVLAPRKAPGQESPDLLDELFDRLTRLILDIRAGDTYRDVLLRQGLLETVVAQ